MSEGTGASAAGTGEPQARAVPYQRPGLTSITPYIDVRVNLLSAALGK